MSNIELPQIDDFRSLLLNSTPLLDVRAPVEFAQGAFPSTTNYPLIDDQERTDIGVCYKNAGQDKAIELGHQLVQGEVKALRVDHWVNFINKNPTGALYCFRGGMRSKISQQWIYERTGIMYPRVKGGYKAMRRFLIDELEASSLRITPIILSGRTGSGKTIFLQNIKQQIDLESIFHHRGSVFGRHVTSQPSQIDIENNLSIQLLKLLDSGFKKIILEDEARNIGSRRLPESLATTMQQSPIILLEVDIEERINIIYQEYIIDALSEYQSHYGKELAFEHWAQQLDEAMDKIQRRLGGVQHKELKKLLNEALQQHAIGNIESHKNWVSLLLNKYYDPMYDYQLNKKQDRIIFRGNKNDVFDYLNSKENIS